MNKRIILIVALVSVVLGSITLIPASRMYSVESRFANGPTDDTQLVNWLKSQTGIVAHTVHIKRRTDMLVLEFVMPQNAWQSPPFPDVEQAALRFGYSIDSNGFVRRRC